MEKPIVHIPVLLQEVLAVFNPQKGEIYIDATVNGGGHAYALAERVGAEGKILGIDRDCDLIERMQEECARKEIHQIIPRCASYRDMEVVAEAESIRNAHGILFDLGFSSYHIDRSQRGFSFLRDEPLDMRYSPHMQDTTAAMIINQWEKEDLAQLFWDEGGERYARRIAKTIIDEF
ncbi:MAG: 16S rRNA (cytosine1402-N4)-methyltransferase [Parcubacteria group bacterium Gr01-1014_66]|nr:MAG: 16S rRNA (cytosine1402-N4)-methyltransferase [Parcubacteria group bacterium Gr01-1014_66]